MKKILALLLAALMVLSAAACTAPAQNGGNNTPAANEEKEEKGEAELASAEAKEVHVLTWSNAATVDYLNSIVDGFHEAYPEYILVIDEVPTSELDQVRQTRITAGNIDVVSFQTFSKAQEDWNKDQIDKPGWQQYIDEGFLEDLTDKEFMKVYNQNILAGNEYNGKRYSLNMFTVAYSGLFYNKAIFEELGLEVPKTWDEFIAVCDKVKEDGRYTVLSAGAADSWPLNMFSNAIMSANYQDDMKEIGKKLLTGEIRHTDPEIKLIYDCMEQFASYLEPGVAGISYSDAPGRFALGNMAMYADGAWSAADIRTAGAEFDFGYFPLPGIEPRKDGLDPQYGIKYDLSFSVPTNAPVKEGAFAFLEYISREDVYTAFVNAVGMTPTRDVQLDNEFLNSLSDGLQAPCINAEMYIYAPKGVGEYGSAQFSFLQLKALGGPFTGEELAEHADEDFDAAREAASSLNE